MIQRLVEGLLYCAAREFVRSTTVEYWSVSTVLSAYDVLCDYQRRR